MSRIGAVCGGRTALAVSGGTDSVFLLNVLAACGADVRAYHAVTPFGKPVDTVRVRSECARLGVPLTEVRVDTLSDPSVSANGPDRCYRCKRAIFSAIAGRARSDGCTIVADGTNASDDPGDRPGMRALTELGVVSPLREAGATKAEVRSMSRDMGLPTWDMPSDSCLATRVRTGTPLTADLLSRVASAEAHVSSMGFDGFRVRTDGSSATLVLRARDLERGRGMGPVLLRGIEPYLGCTVLDPEGREDGL
ncbi:MAG: ATP-dependent sacrificial sulfur transferase LarE [Candidatus Methanomethylophilaceae archaeon]|nr:ATP-dependent sacrificial sulfur transferase LarE [Candidatus Methanomethylophilaceae archaeon]